MDDQSGPIGADDAILHRERVSKSGGRADICGRTPGARRVFRWTYVSAVAGYVKMSTCRCAQSKQEDGELSRCSDADSGERQRAIRCGIKDVELGEEAGCNGESGATAIKSPQNLDALTLSSPKDE